MDNDTISRQAAIDDAHSQIWYRLNPNMKERIDAWLVNLPAVQPKQKTGRWEHDGGHFANRWICSQCGYKLYFEKSEAKYCPNCGAKMENGGNLFD